MAATVPVQALALVNIPRRLQQVMAKNRGNLEKAGIWEFVLWVRDVEKVVHEDKVANFVHTYQLKTKTALVGAATVDFSTTKISAAFSLPNRGFSVDALPEMKKQEAEEIFEYKFRWGKDMRWGIGLARHHWKMWFDFVNNYLLFRPDEGKMDHKYVLAAIRTWEGVEVNWAFTVQ